MRKKELLKRIEQLERRVTDLEANRWTFTWTNPASTGPITTYPAIPPNTTWIGGLPSNT